jgi:hypothetical protein
LTSKSSRAMIQALIGGETDADRMADMAQRWLLAKIPR